MAFQRHFPIRFDRRTREADAASANRPVTGTIFPRRFRRAIGLRLSLLAAILVNVGCSSTGGSGLARVDPTLSPEQNLRKLAREERPEPPEQVALPPGVDPEALTPTDAPRSGLDMTAALADIRATAGSVAPADEGFDPTQLEPPTDDAVKRLAFSFYARGREAALDGQDLLAVTEYHKALQLDPSSVTVMRQLARSYLIVGNLPRAIRLYWRVLRIEGDDPEARLTIGVAAADRRDFTTAAVVLGHPWLAGTGELPYYTHDPMGDHLASYSLALAFRELGYDQAMIDAMKATVTVSPGTGVRTVYSGRLGVIYRQRAELWRSIGDAYCRLGEYQQALQSYANAAKLPMPDPGSLYPRVVYANLRLGRPFNGQAELLTGLETHDGKVSDRDIRLCQYLADYGQPVDVLADAVKLLYAAHPETANLARATAALLPSEEAQQLLRDFLYRRPRDVKVVSELLHWMMQKDPAGASALAVGLAADHPDLAEQYAEHLLAVAPGPKPILEALRQEPPSPARTNIEARVLALAEAPGEAWRVCWEALETWPGDPTLLRLEVELAGRLGEPLLLAEAMRHSAALQDTRSLLVQSRALRGIGRLDEAASIADRAYENAHDDEERYDALVARARAEFAVASRASDENLLLTLGEKAADTARLAARLDPQGRDDAYEILVELYRPGGPLADRRSLLLVRRELVKSNPHSRVNALMGAREAIGQGLYEQSLDRLLNLYESDPTDTESLSLAVSAWGQMQRWPDARRWLEERRGQQPGYPPLLDQWVRVLLEQSDLETVIQVLRDAVEADPDNYAALRLLESTLTADRQVEESVQLGERRLMRRPIGVRRELGLAAMYVRGGWIDKAIEHLRWIESEGAEGGIEYLLSALAIANGLPKDDRRRDETLLALAERSIGLHPDSPLRVYGTAMVSMARLGPIDSRFETLARQAVESAPRAGESTMPAAMQWRRLAQAMVDSGEPLAAALAIRARLYAIAPLEPQARSLLTLVAMAADAGAGGQAEETIALVRDLDSRGQLPAADGSSITLIDALYDISTLYMLVGDTRGSDRLLQEILSETADHAMTLNNLGYLRLGDEGPVGLDPQVPGWVLRAYELVPEDPNVLDTVGWLLYKQGRLADLAPPDQPGQADQGDTAADDTGGDDPSAVAPLELPLDIEVRGAVSFIRAALDLEEEPSGEVHEHLGDALYRLGDTEGAMAAWREAEKTLDNAELRERVTASFLRFQQGWGLVVADPEQMYDREYGQVLTRIRDKIQAVEQGSEPALPPTFAEMSRD